MMNLMQSRWALRHILPLPQGNVLRRSCSGAAVVALLIAAVPAIAQPEQAGSAALAEGTVIATGNDGVQRNLHDGDAVYSGDSITTGSDSYADLELDDGGRILVRPGSIFQIAEYHFDPAAHGLVDTDSSQQDSTADDETHESAIFRLIKGGLRAIDGLIGKSNPNEYAMQTPVATIGIRGTEYDVRYCDNNCQDEAENGKVPDNGLYTAVNEGAIGVS
ncbi:MAG TPA: FecR domain-containing protein, partial [Gammaproteobacteria bacterium]|nr:FecR domain-containing protein [Gammaproteobacteria bacterium]